MLYNARLRRYDLRSIFFYEGPDLVPPPLHEPLIKDEYAPFVNVEEPVTFTVKVPFGDLVTGGSDHLRRLVEEIAFADALEISSAEYRSVGSEFESFDSDYCGLVHVQVTCRLSYC